MPAAGPTAAELRAQALAARGRADLLQTLRIWDAIVRAVPVDHDARIRVADTLARAGRAAEAASVYTAAARFAIRAGHPLPAVVAIRCLASLGAQAAPLWREAAAWYAAGSQRTARRAARLSASFDAPVDARRLSAAVPAEQAIAEAVAAACDDGGVRFPEHVLRVALLSDLPPDGFARVGAALRVARLPDGHLAIREGDPGDSIFLVASGQLVITQGPEARELGRVGEGALVGEMAMFKGGVRTASARAAGEADLLEIDRGTLVAIGRELPGVAHAIDRFRRERLLSNLMATSPLFSPFAPEQRVDLLRRFEGYDVPAGAVVLAQGAPSPGLFVVLSGAVRITRAEEGRTVDLAVLESGEVFGEVSLLHDTGATASVTALRPTALLRLDRRTFQKIVDAVPEVRRHFAELAAARMARTTRALGEDVLIEEDEDLAGSLEVEV